MQADAAVVYVFWVGVSYPFNEVNISFIEVSLVVNLIISFCSRYGINKTYITPEYFMIEYYHDNAKSQWDAYFKMKGEERNPPTDAIFYMRKKIIDTVLTMAKANYQDELFKEMYNNYPNVKEAFPDEDVFIYHMKKALELDV